MVSRAQVDVYSSVMIATPPESERHGLASSTTEALKKRHKVATKKTLESKGKSTKEHVCPICAELIVDEGTDSRAQDTLFCEGDCKTWLHQWCTSMTKEQYAVLSASEKPFL